MKMNTFWKILLETADQNKIQETKFQTPEFTFRKTDSKIPQILHPVITELEKMKRLNMTFSNGNPINYSMGRHTTQDSYDGWGGLIIKTPSPCYIKSWNPGKSDSSLELRLPSAHGSSYHCSSHRTTKTLLPELARYLGTQMGDLGPLDKSIYSQSVQDTLGI
jgi:hypothetical protein